MRDRRIINTDFGPLSGRVRRGWGKPLLCRRLGGFATDARCRKAYPTSYSQSPCMLCNARKESLLMAKTALQTTCCIVGAGPAGIMLGYLLARKGVAVTVLEKHQDFFRDFRGDTVHPSTLEVMHELGLLQEFLRLPHQ